MKKISCSKTVNGNHVWAWEIIDNEKLMNEPYKISERCVFCKLWKGENYRYLVKGQERFG